MEDRISVNPFHRQPDMICPVLFHLLAYRLRHYVTGLKFVCKTVSILVEQDCSLSPYGFRDKESPSRFSGIECRRMNLYIIQMFQPYSVLLGDAQGISRQMRIIGRMFIEPADASTCKDRVWRPDHKPIPCGVFRNDPRTLLILYYNICHSSILHDRHIFKQTHLCQQSACYLLSCYIFMEQDTRSGVSSFSCKLIILQEIFCIFTGRFFSCELHAVSDQLFYDIP